jgi:Surface antigen variable number repeat
MKAVAVMLLLATFAFAQQREPDDIPMNIVLTGASAIPPEIKQAIQKEIAHTVTDPAQIPNEMMERIRDQFQQYGYFQALVSNPERKEVWDSGVLKEINLTVKIDAGGRYKLGDIQFVNATVFDSPTLRKLIPMRQGEVFDVEKMRIGLKSLRYSYCAHGYINSTPLPNMDIDDEHLSINVTFDIDEGSQFRYGRLILDGPEPYPGAGKKLLDGWKSYEGQIYSCVEDRTFQSLISHEKISGVVEAFFADAIRRDEWPATKINNDTHTVDFRYEFPDPK